MSREIRVIVIGAHPDEPDIYAGGMAALYAEQGHRVKFLSLTDGCCGHYSIGGNELVGKRKRKPPKRRAGSASTNTRCWTPLTGSCFRRLQFAMK